METRAFVTQLGPLEALYADPQVLDILVDAPDRVLVQRQGSLEDSGVRFESVEALQAVIDAVLQAGGTRLSAGQSVVDQRLPDGTRVVAVLPPTAVDGPCLVLRKLPTPFLDWEQLVAYGCISSAALETLRGALTAHRNLLIAGSRSSGKTTLMNLVAEDIPPEERIVVVQTNMDLRVRHPRALFLAGEATGTDLSSIIAAAEKMRPDWLVIGELHGAEAMAGLEALNRGHHGILNLHAESAEDALSRLETFCLMSNLGLGLGEIRAIIAASLQVVLFQRRMPDGVRRVEQMVEILGLENGQYVLQPLFRFDRGTMRLEAGEQKPSWM